MRLRTASAAASTVGCTTVPRNGEASVITDATSSGRWLATARAMIPPRLWPMRWIFSLGIEERFVDVVPQPLLDQKIGTLRVQSDPREVRPVADAAQPRVHLRKVSVGPQKSRNQHHRRAVAARDAESVIHRRRVQQQKVSGKQRFLPNGDVSFGVLLMKRADGRRCHRRVLDSSFVGLECPPLQLWGTPAGVTAEAASGKLVY